MKYLLAVGLIGLFSLLLRLVKVTDVARRIVQASLDATAAIRRAELSDMDKERAARCAAIQLARALLDLLLRTTVAAAGALLVAWLLVLAGTVGVGELEAAMRAWPVVVATVILGLLVLLA